jgi:hypothetical protein
MSATRVGFLFNHDALHQVAHSAPLIAELKSVCPELDVSVLASSDEQFAEIREHVPDAKVDDLTWIRLGLSPLAQAVERIARHLLPFRRVEILRSNRDLLRTFDALVVPEATSAMLKSRFGLSKLKLIYTHHGAGDRSVGFGEELREFDLILVAGPKIRDRLLATGLVDEDGFAVVGYPKFDVVTKRPREREALFPNDRPTVLYNPHFEPRLSSWYDMGLQVLDYFAAHPEYNLVFAPHVMLFRRRVHTSLESFKLRFRRSLPERYLRYSNIRVDLGGTSCIDMTYTLGADVYLGDVSSQIYEFILRPRPCIFLNAHGAQWRDDPNYLHWNCGPVLQDVADLDPTLAQASEDHAAFRSVQESLFAQTIDLSDVPSSRRAALAITDFLSR